MCQQARLSPNGTACRATDPPFVAACPNAAARIGGELILIPAQRGPQTVYVVLFGSSRTCWKLCPMFWKMVLMAVAEG